MSADIPHFSLEIAAFSVVDSNPWALSASLCPLRVRHWSRVTRVITGITCRLLSPSLSFLLSLQYTSWKWTWSFVYCNVQPSKCECAQTSLSILLFLLMSALPFCHKVLHFPIHPLHVAPDNSHWESRLNVWGASDLLSGPIFLV